MDLMGFSPGTREGVKFLSMIVSIVYLLFAWKGLEKKDLIANK